MIQVIHCSREAKVTSQQRWHLDRFWRRNKSSVGREKNFRSNPTSDLYITMQKHQGMERQGIFLSSETFDVVGEEGDSECLQIKCHHLETNGQ